MGETPRISSSRFGLIDAAPKPIDARPPHPDLLSIHDEEVIIAFKITTSKHSKQHTISSC